MKDEEILELFFLRSEEAVAELDRQFGGLLRRILCDLLSDSRDAEECLSDVYLSVWNAIPPARPASLKAYVCRIGRNAALDRLRARGAAARSGYNAALEELSEILPDGETPESLTAARELGRCINGFLSGLKKTDRILFLRRYWYGQGLENTAAELGMTKSQASVRLFRLRKRLRQYLEKEGFTV